jgi:hypothetical protein
VSSIGFNPLLIGEAAPPLSKTSPYHTITLSGKNPDLPHIRTYAFSKK